MLKLSHPYLTTGKNIALTIRTFVGKAMSLLFNMLSRFVIDFLPKSQCLLISWLQSPSAVILEPKKIKSLSFYCCILTCIQISQEAGQVVWYSHLFQNSLQCVDKDIFFGCLLVLDCLIGHHRTIQLQLLWH